MKNRSPLGKFIERDQMITAWVPVMLRWIYTSPLTVLLEAAKEFCFYRYRGELESLTQNTEHENCNLTGEWQNRHFAKAQLWLKRRDVLDRTIEELEAIK